MCLRQFISGNVAYAFVGRAQPIMLRSANRCTATRETGCRKDNHDIQEMSAFRFCEQARYLRLSAIAASEDGIYCVIYCKRTALSNDEILRLNAISIVTVKVSGILIAIHMFKSDNQKSRSVDLTLDHYKMPSKMDI